MNYTDILIYMRHEVTLMAIIIVLFIYDLAAGKRGRSRFSAVACCLLIVQVAVNIVPMHQTAELFGGMFVYAPVASSPSAPSSFAFRPTRGCDATIRSSNAANTTF